MDKAKKTEKKSVVAPRMLWEGLDTLDGEPIASFIESVEDAFEALHQPGFGAEGDESPEAPVSVERFVEWAKSVEDRFEYMGLSHISLGFPDKPAPNVPLDKPALLKWTKRVWARFAAFGQLLPDPSK